MIGLVHHYKKPWLHDFYKSALLFEDILIDETDCLMLSNRKPWFEIDLKLASQD